MHRHAMTAISRDDHYATILVKYSQMDGYHIFTSPEVRGLYVASKDAEKAYSAVGPTLADLLEIATGQRCVVEPAKPIEEFLRVRTAAGGFTPRIMADRNYLVRCADAA